MKKTGIVLAGAVAAAMFAFAGCAPSYEPLNGTETTQIITTQPSYTSLTSESGSSNSVDAYTALNTASTTDYNTPVKVTPLTAADGSDTGAAQTGAAYDQVVKGSTGQAVTNLQNELKDLGYLKADATGYFGSETLSAVLAFQKANYLKQDGVVGNSTWDVLRAGNAIAAK